MIRGKIVLTCPEHWSATTVHLLAQRLLADELPANVGVEVHSPDAFMEDVLREPDDEL